MILDSAFGLTVAERLVIFYADDGLISTTDNEWLQSALNVLCGLFKRIGLTKTKVVTCFPTNLGFSSKLVEMLVFIIIYLVGQLCKCTVS